MGTDRAGEIAARHSLGASARSVTRVTTGCQPVMPSPKVTISRHSVTQWGDTWATWCVGADGWPRTGPKHATEAGARRLGTERGEAPIGHAVTRVVVT